MNALFEECFGHCRHDADCRDCDLRASCACISDTEPHIEQHSGMTSVEELEGWALQLSTPAELPDGEEEPDTAAAPPLTEDLSRLSEFCRYIFSLDDYTIGILATIIAPAKGNSGNCTVAELARLHGCTRQGMHRKMLSAVRRYPELASLFRVVLRKIGRGRAMFRHREECRV